MKTRNQIVSLILGLLACGSSIFAGAEQNPPPEDNKPPVGEPVVGVTPLLISEVFKKRDQLVGRKVEIVACLLTHFEGPWICLHPDAPLRNTISLKLPKGCVLTAKDGKKELDWHEDNKGYPAVISGTLRIRPKLSPDDPRIGLYVDVTSGRELAVDDPLWRNYIQQFKQEGEQGGDGQPATASESKPVDHDSPQQESILPPQ